MRYAIMSDTHGNMPAQEAVLADAEHQNIDAFIFLGDAVGYYAESEAVVSCLQEHIRPLPQPLSQAAILPWLPGNHEWGLVGKLDEGHFDAQALRSLQRTRLDMPAPMVEFLRDRPQRIEIDLGDGIFVTCVHASPADPVGASGAGYIRNSEDAAMSAQLFSTQLCLVGHTHYPRIFHQAGTSVTGQARWITIDVLEQALPGGCYHFADERLILNPGSVGQSRDGDSRASYAVLDTAERTFCVRRTRYNINLTRDRLRAWLADVPRAELDKPAGLAGRLEWGV